MAVIERQRLENRHLNLCDRITGMAAKGELTYDEAVWFESSFYDILVDLGKVYSKIHHVLSCKRFKKYCRMLRKEYDIETNLEKIRRLL